MHFCVVAELADDLDPAALDAALLAVQQRHPLLNVYVGDHLQTRLGFYGGQFTDQRERYFGDCPNRRLACER
jgi:hypothetical protein